MTQPSPLPTDLIGTQEACALVGVDRGAIGRARDSGHLTGYRRIGNRRWMYSRAEVIAHFTPRPITNTEGTP